jgi:hypothetical protein
LLLCSFLKLHFPYWHFSDMASVWREAGMRSIADVGSANVGGQVLHAGTKASVNLIVGTACLDGAAAYGLLLARNDVRILPFRKTPRQYLSNGLICVGRQEKPGRAAWPNQKRPGA